MVELCLVKGLCFIKGQTSLNLSIRMLDVYLHFSELKIPKVFISMEAEKIKITSKSSAQFDDEILTFNDLYLKIGYISSLQERIKLVTPNYFEKKMLNDLLYVMATELFYGIPKSFYLFQKIQISDEMVCSMLKRHIGWFYEMESIHGNAYIKFARKYEEIFKLNNIW